MLIPRYFSNAGRPQFGSFYLPQSPQWPVRWVVFCPPFAEELNKSRALMAEQARRLNASGYGVLSLDLHGAGDSPYPLDADCVDWLSWVEQIVCAVTWLNQQTIEKVTLCGLRLGGLLALEAHQQLRSSVEDLCPVEIFLWQPVLSGKTFMTQFLRLRTAAGMMSGESPETVSGLRAKARKDGYLEVAGYRLTDRLMTQIDGLAAGDYAIEDSTSIHWFEVSRRGDKPLAPVQQKLIKHWREQGGDVDLHRVDGDAFWAAQELVSLPALIEQTNCAITKSASSASKALVDESRLAIEVLDLNLPAMSMSAMTMSAKATAAQASTIDCQGQALVSLTHYPKQFNGRAVLLVVGGPQYRVGSHRQFVELAQSLADDGYLVARFDCRGMGDSEGQFPGFESIDNDISVAVDSLYGTGLDIQSLSLWGLCDAATAIAFYAGGDSRVKQLVLLNPWVRSDVSLAKAKLKHYYAKRFFEKSFWSKLFTGQLKIMSSLKGLKTSVLSSLASSAASGSAVSAGSNTESRRDRTLPLIEQLHQSLLAFDGRVLLLLSGRDLTAQEFDMQADGYKPMGQWLGSKRVDIRRIADADHTFSRSEHKRDVERITSQWLRDL